jgi:hypothetical protein
MATLTAQTVAKKLAYQKDATNNRQEAPGTGNITGGTGTVVPADGSNIPASATAGQSPNITRIPKPGQGYPTGKSAAHSSGTYNPLVQPVVQQSNESVSGQAYPAVPVGFHISADGHSHPGTNDLQNELLNDVSSMSAAATTAQTSDPTPATGVGPAAGLSQSPELQ